MLFTNQKYLNSFIFPTHTKKYFVCKFIWQLLCILMQSTSSTYKTFHCWQDNTIDESYFWAAAWASTLDGKKYTQFCKKVGTVLLHFVPAAFGFIKRLFGKLPCFCSYDNPLKLRVIAEWRFKTLITTTPFYFEQNPKVSEYMYNEYLSKYVYFKRFIWL